jgi:carboxymethylenebutenolidase
MPPFNTQIQSHDGASFGAYFAKANTANAPVLIVIQEIFGVNASMRAMCDQWAVLGYHVMCPDLFWRQKPGVELTDKTPAEWEQAFGYFKGFDLENGIKDLQSTLALARTISGNGKVASMGFCLGGLLSYLMATRSDADCNISYYGVGLTDYLNEVSKIKNPLLLHFAQEDKYTQGPALTQVMATLATNSTTQPYVYEKVQHAFARINGEHFDAAASALAQQRSEAFLAKNLM